MEVALADIYVAKINSSFKSSTMFQTSPAEYNQSVFAFLEKDRIEKIKKIRSESEKLLRIYASVFVKLYVSKNTGISLSKLKYLYQHNGKPYFNDCPIKFNISHTKNTLAIGFSSSEIGVDVEEIRQIDLKLAKRYFTENENMYIFENNISANFLEQLNMPCFCTNDSDALYKRFFCIWTRKEAFVKRSGTGLCFKLNSVDLVDVNQSRGILTIEKDNRIISVATNDKENKFNFIDEKIILSMVEECMKTNESTLL